NRGRPVGNGLEGAPASSLRRGPGLARNSCERPFPAATGFRDPRPSGGPGGSGVPPTVRTAAGGRAAAPLPPGGVAGRRRWLPGASLSGASPVGRLGVGTAPVTRGRAGEVTGLFFSGV